MIDVDIEETLGTFRLAVTFKADARVVGLFGRSGSGKTSVINAIAGIGRPHRGAIRIDGETLFDSAREIDVPPEKRRIGYVFQDALLFPHLDVEANLDYGQRLRAPAERIIAQDRVVELLGLGPLLRRKPRTLSGGERQRVAIGRALLAPPRILLMDEPLASLDFARKVEILDYIERLRAELPLPIVYVSHSVAEIERLADAVVVLEGGRCVALGAVDEVMRRSELQPATDRLDAGALIEADITRHDAEDGLTTLAFDGGALRVPLLDLPAGHRVRLHVRARDVALATSRPHDISTLNVLPGRVEAVAAGAQRHVEVRVAVGRATIVSRITPWSRRQLGIEPGREVYALIKAVSLDRPFAAANKDSAP